jgi:predicted DNA-binding protein
MATPKQDEIKVRVTQQMKSRVVALAHERGESESVIVREALNAYLLSEHSSSARQHPTAPHKVSYKKSSSKPGRKVV